MPSVWPLLDGGFSAAERAAVLTYADKAEGDALDPSDEWELRGAAALGFCTPAFQQR